MDNSLRQMGIKRIDIRELFNRVNEWAIKKSPLVPKLSLELGCSEIVACQRAGDIRAVCHVGHKKGKVCADIKAHRLPINFLVGIFLHEIGHPLAMRVYRRSDQWDADRAVKEILGVNIRYGGPLVLEHVSMSVAKKISRV